MGKEKLNDVKYHLDHHCTFYPYLELDSSSMQFYSYRKKQLGRLQNIFICIQKLQRRKEVICIWKMCIFHIKTKINLLNQHELA